MKYQNNPLNIRFNPANNWQGQTSPKKGFCQFKNLYYGYRASYLLVVRYRSFGCCTVRQIISRWAPKSDGNNTESYINFVANFLGVDDNFVVTDNEVYALLSAMTRIEQGSFDAYVDSQLQRTLLILGVKCDFSLGNKK